MNMMVKEKEGQLAQVVDYKQKLTAEDIIADVKLIQQVMAESMRDGVHYGLVPGCGNKPALLKPGAEKIASTFRLAVNPKLDIIDTEDDYVVNVECILTHIPTGNYVGTGIGVCSWKEQKYYWKEAVHDKEYQAVPENQKRIKYFRDGKETKQIRTNKADQKNTLQKMAVKRALVGGVLTATAASDIFAQDIEEFDDEQKQQQKYASSNNNDLTPELVLQCHANINDFYTIVRNTMPRKNDVGDWKISEGQLKRLFAIQKANNVTDDELKGYLKKFWNIDSRESLAKDNYNWICELSPKDSKVGFLFLLGKCKEMKVTLEELHQDLINQGEKPTGVL